MAAPLVLVVGRVSPAAKGVRGPAFAAGRTYAHAIERAGGIPVIVPPIPELGPRFDQLVRRADAIVLHGGGDVDPARYDAEPHDTVGGVQHEHDEAELSVVRAALDADVPMLAICRGLQVLNVAMGGSLVQDIGREDHWFAHTTVSVAAGSKAADAFGAAQIGGCHCVHHQVLDRVADGLRVTGTHADGTVHVAEVMGASWIVGVQWHPEDTAHDDPVQQSLFTALLAHT
jgi:putative glutamine amidotransferase